MTDEKHIEQQMDTHVIYCSIKNSRTMTAEISSGYFYCVGKILHPI